MEILNEDDYRDTIVFPSFIILLTTLPVVVFGFLSLASTVLLLLYLAYSKISQFSVKKDGKFEWPPNRIRTRHYNESFFWLVNLFIASISLPHQLLIRHKTLFNRWLSFYAYIIYARDSFHPALFVVFKGF